MLFAPVKVIDPRAIVMREWGGVRMGEPLLKSHHLPCIYLILFFALNYIISFDKGIYHLSIYYLVHAHVHVHVHCIGLSIFLQLVQEYPHFFPFATKNKKDQTMAHVG